MMMMMIIIIITMYIRYDRSMSSFTSNCFEKLQMLHLHPYIWYLPVVCNVGLNNISVMFNKIYSAESAWFL